MGLFSAILDKIFPTAGRPSPRAEARREPARLMRGRRR